MKQLHWMKWLILIGCIGLCIILFAASDSDEEDIYGNKSVVYKEELKDLLLTIQLSKEEAEGIFCSQVSDVMTWKDIYYVFDTLQCSSVVEDRDDKSITAVIPRQKFQEVVEAYLKNANIIWQEECFTYLGHIPTEDKIITDKGNFYTCLPESFFTYGEKYNVLCNKNSVIFVSDVNVSSGNVEPDGIDANAVSTSLESIMPTYINILLTNDNNQKPLRDDFQIKVTSSCSVTSGTMKKTFDKNKTFSPNTLSEYFKSEKAVMIIPDEDQSIYIRQADSGEWSSPYRGVLFIYAKGDQYWLVNQLDLESYLYAVVPGEMPERFHIEALKAQAVCARTYACNMINSDAYAPYYADADDSVNCQVYNKHGENKKATEAVDSTMGLVLSESNDMESFSSLQECADIYYFSTSCGFTTGLEAWGASSESYLSSVTTLYEDKTIEDWASFLKNKTVEAYDSGSNYFRWTAILEVPDGCEIQVEEREKSGVVTCISYKKGNEKRTVSTEHAIRADLGKYVIKLKDINEKDIDMDILPSAWFAIEKTSNDKKYILYGGGYGHGIGMCQYGANGMAEKGMTYDAILKYYFNGISINNLYKN